MEFTTLKDLANATANATTTTDVAYIIEVILKQTLPVVLTLGVLCIGISFSIFGSKGTSILDAFWGIPTEEDCNNALKMYTCVRKKRKKLFKTKEILVDEVKCRSLELLTIATREQILSRIQPKFDVIRTLTEESKRVKAEYALMTPYMELLYKDLSQAIGQTEHDYEEGQLLDNLTYTEQALNKIIEKLEAEKKWDDEEQEIKQTIIKESELQAHMDDMAATKALMDML